MSRTAKNMRRSVKVHRTSLEALRMLSAAALLAVVGEQMVQRRRSLCVPRRPRCGSGFSRYVMEREAGRVTTTRNPGWGKGAGTARSVKRRKAGARPHRQTATTRRLIGIILKVAEGPRGEFAR